MKNLRRDIGVVGRHLADPAMPAFGCQTDKGNVWRGEGLEPGNFHGSNLLRWQWTGCGVTECGQSTFSLDCSMPAVTGSIKSAATWGWEEQAVRHNQMVAIS